MCNKQLPFGCFIYLFIFLNYTIHITTHDVCKCSSLQISYTFRLIVPIFNWLAASWYQNFNYTYIFIGEIKRTYSSVLLLHHKYIKLSTKKREGCVKFYLKNPLQSKFRTPFFIPVIYATHNRKYETIFWCPVLHAEVYSI